MPFPARRGTSTVRATSPRLVRFHFMGSGAPYMATLLSGRLLEVSVFLETIALRRRWTETHGRYWRPEPRARTAGRVTPPSCPSRSDPSTPIPCHFQIGLFRRLLERWLTASAPRTRGP